MKRYFDDWHDINDLIRDFEITPDDIKDEEIIFASYLYESYSGTAFVLFERDGQLYEVNASHCSRYGLEDQWSPEETSWPALRMRSEVWRKEYAERYDDSNASAGWQALVSGDAPKERMEYLANLIDLCTLYGTITTLKGEPK